MASTLETSPSIKADPTSSLSFSPVSATPDNPLKRTSSDPIDEPAKRQRLPDDEFTRLLALATQNTNLQLEQNRPGSSTPQSQNAAPVPETPNVQSSLTSDPYLYMRIFSLPILESLSTQMVSRLSKEPLSETIRILGERSSEQGQAYHTLKSLFDQTKKMYSQTKNFLSADDLNIHEPKHRATIRITNVATFVASILGDQDVGFYELNDNFLHTFVGEQGLTRDVGMLFLDFKTQLYLSVSMSEEQMRSKEDALDDLFPTDPQKLLDPGRHIGPGELDFIAAVKARRTYLTSVPHNIEDIQNLSVIFPWEGFLTMLTNHLRLVYEPLIAPYMQRHALTAPTLPPAPPSLTPTPSIEHDISRETALAINATLKSMQAQSQPQQSPQQPPPPVPAPQPRQQQQQSPAPQPTYQPPPQPQIPQPQNQWPPGSIPDPTQSAPTAVLYERARQAAAAKSNPGSARRPGLPSQRRPWTQEEENTLMAGLDQVKGPHWSQILNLYGPKGQVNDVLKDRNQVQLKDKARNLKLFFLKSGMEVPYFLQNVTGDLKTRAPGQAAKKETEEAARLASDEERQRVNGILTLANGLTEASGSLDLLDENEEMLSGDDFGDFGEEGGEGVDGDGEVGGGEGGADAKIDSSNIEGRQPEQQQQPSSSVVA